MTPRHRCALRPQNQQCDPRKLGLRWFRPNGWARSARRVSLGRRTPGLPTPQTKPWGSSLLLHVLIETRRQHSASRPQQPLPTGLLAKRFRILRIEEAEHHEPEIIAAEGV